MYFSYFDESGDDGFPKYSSELFVLTSIYFNYRYWKLNYERIYEFKKEFKKNYGFPVKEEFHTKEFIQDKNPYHGKYDAAKRRVMLFEFFELIPTLKMRIVNVVIDKKKIKTQGYDVCARALTYNIQRIENDLNSLMHLIRHPRFMIITDEGRLQKMRSTARAIQKVNFIPSRYSNSFYQSKIKNVIEDVLSKKSYESYFIQIADMVSFIISLYARRNKCSPALDWGKRIKSVLQEGDEIKLLEIIKPKLNLKASSTDPYGVVCYPL